MKKLVIVSGVTGAIGNSLLAKYLGKKDFIVYGLSRQGVKMKNFIDPSTKKFHTSTFICSIGKLTEKNYSVFLESIDYDSFSEIIYVHALGVYPFELNEKGEHIVEFDKDKDGIDDRCTFLSYNLFKLITAKILRISKASFKAIIFGGIADKHRPVVHSSWWKTMEKVKRYASSIKNSRASMHLFNISSVICSHEIITRPNIFIKTNANPRYWLSPEDISKKVFKILKKNKPGFFEHNFFKIRPKFDREYYLDKKFTPRKVSELF